MQSQERQNAARCTLGEGLFGLGMGFIAPLTVMPLLLKQLGAGPVEIGFFHSMASAGFLLTQPLGMFLSRHGAGKKRFLLTFNASVTLPVFLFMAAVILIMGRAPHQYAMARALLLGAFSLRMLSLGTILPIWQDWINGLFKIQNRGRVTGLYAAASAIGVMTGTLIASNIRWLVRFPENYVGLLLIAAVFFALSLSVYAFVDSGIAPQEEGSQRPRIGELLNRFSLSLGDANFVHYLVGRLLLTAGGVAIAFFAVHFQSEAGGGLSEAAIIGLGAFVMLPQALSSYWLGQLGDRSGHRRGVVIGAFAQVGSIAFAVLGSGPIACIICFLLLGIAYAAGWVSHQNFIYETCPHDNRVAHFTLSNLVLSPLIVFMPIGAGGLIAVVGAVYGMAVCLLISVAGAFYLLVFVDEPRMLILGQRRKSLPKWLRALRVQRKAQRRGEDAS